VTMDGQVDAADLALVIGNYGVAEPWAGGDVTYDGTVGAADLAFVIGNYGTALPALADIAGSQIDGAGIALLSAHGITPVPEPGTIALLAASLAGLLSYAWLRRKHVA
jgi:hypothetical protein